MASYALFRSCPKEGCGDTLWAVRQPPRPGLMHFLNSRFGILNHCLGFSPKMTPVAIGQSLQPVPAEPRAGSSGEKTEVGLTGYTEPGLQLGMVPARTGVCCSCNSLSTDASAVLDSHELLMNLFSELEPFWGQSLQSYFSISIAVQYANGCVY